MIFIFILIISDKSVLFPNAEGDQRLVLGISIGHLKNQQRGNW